jgi:hypothetical protein
MVNFKQITVKRLGFVTTLTATKSAHISLQSSAIVFPVLLLGI